MRSRILLADDSITIQKVVNLTFADEGIDVVAVSNGEMAEKRLSDVNPDLVLADIFMPGKNGYELCDTIKKNPQFRNVPVLLLVGAFEPFDQLEAKRVKADGHLTKPFESRTLVETVRKLIQSASVRPHTGQLPSAAPQPEAEAQADPLDTNPMTPPPTVETVAPEFPIEVAMPLSETSPLEIDYSAPAPLLTEDVESVFPEPDSEPAPALETGFVRTTGALSSVGPGAVHNASDNGNTEFQTESYVDASQSDAVSSEFAPPAGAGMPSQFGEQGGELVLDFDAGVEPPATSPSVTTEADSAVELAGSGGPEAPAVEPLIAEGPSVNPVMDPAMETDFVAIDAPLEELPSPVPDAPKAAVLAADEPLGDVLSETRPAISAEPMQPGSFTEGASMLADQLEMPTAELANLAEASADVNVTAESFASGKEEPVEAVMEMAPPAPGIDVMMPPPVVPSTFDIDDTGVGDTQFAGSESQLTHTAQPEPVAPFGGFEVTQQSGSAPVVSATEASAPSARWTETHAAQPSIDIEARPVEEIEEVAVESNNVAESEAEPLVSTAAFKPATTPVESDDAPLPEHMETGGSVSDTFEAATSSAQSVAEVESDAVAEVESRSEPVFPDQVMTDLPSATTDADSSAMSQSMIDEIVRRVLAELSESVVREIAWEVVPDCVERVVGQMTRDGVAKRI
jgi:CheY-like chemotaxis protein